MIDRPEDSTGIAVGKIVQIALILYNQLNRELEKSADLNEPMERRAEILEAFFSRLTPTELIMFEQALEYLEDSLKWIRYMAAYSIAKIDEKSLPHKTRAEMPAEYLNFRNQLEKELNRA